METAEEFAEQYLSAIGADTDEAPALADAIRARDNATRRALLDELIALDDGSEETLTVYRAVGILRLKYEPVVG